MSSMTMNTYVPRIWGYDLKSPEARVALESGWSRADLLWEHMMERANMARAEGQGTLAVRLLRRADMLARLCFASNDLRRATGLINLAIADLERGASARAERRLDRAAALWDKTARTAIDDMQIAPRSRSSLFHLRMEALHRDTFHGNMRVRFGHFADETFETIRALRAGQAATHRHFGRWRGERPVVYDDTRKILSACLLVFDG